MKPLTLFLLACTLFPIRPVLGDVYTINIVGYYNVSIFPGDNLIANQLVTTNQRLNNLIRAGGFAAIPDGITFTKWDSSANTFLPPSIYDALSDSWSINYTLELGEGGVLHSPSIWTNTFVGSVAVFTNILNDLGPGTLWHPDYANGNHLIACPDPLGGPISTMFPFVTGRVPMDGESVGILYGGSQIYVTSTFHTGSGWDNGDPILPVGNSAWFNLGPVPEPSPAVLSASGLAVMLMRARVRFRMRREPQA